jgi:hypothetical protein
MVGELVAGKHPEGEVLCAVPFDLPGGANPDGVGVQQHTEQQLGVIGRVAVPVGAVDAQERLKVELVDHVQDEPGQVVGWQPVAQVGREQERLVAVAGQEVVGHGACYPIAPLAPNVSFLRVNAPATPSLTGGSNLPKATLRWTAEGRRPPPTRSRAAPGTNSLDRSLGLAAGDVDGPGLGQAPGAGQTA